MTKTSARPREASADGGARGDRHRPAPHFEAGIEDTDPELARVLALESGRQQSQIELIASENLVSRATLEALGSRLTNKTVEGYPGNRYHGGAEFVDVAERLAIERACRLFGTRRANVQAHSGSQANQAVYLALLEPGDTILGLTLTAGGHLSHGAAANLSGKWFRAIGYGVDPATCRIDYAAVEDLARAHRPKLLIAGGSAYPRRIDFARMRRIADAVDAHLLVDMAHFAGLVAGAVHPSPVPHAHVVTCTTTKTLRGPRGGVILTDDAVLARRIDSAVFPGLQGSVHLSTVAAKAVCLGEALRPSFKVYARRVLENARALASSLAARDVDVLTGGTDTHLVLASVSGLGLTGARAEQALAAAGITCNKNPAPFDPPRPARWSGLRLGVCAGTTRGFGTGEFRLLADVIADLLHASRGEDALHEETVVSARARVAELCARFPIYASLG